MDDRTILQHIERQPHAAAGFKQLVRELRVRGDERRQLSDRLRKLVERGTLIENARGRYTLPAAKPQPAEPPARGPARAASHGHHGHGRMANAVAGRLSMHRDGYGFVTPDDPALRQKISGDIYIAPPAIGPAMHGDHVLVEIGPVRHDGRAEGRIVRVAERAHVTVVGTFHRGRQHNYVTPMDAKIALDIVIPPGMEWPEPEEGAALTKESRHRVIGKEARRRVIEDVAHRRVIEDVARRRVIGDEAKTREISHRDNLRHESREAEALQNLDGVVVDVEITRWPSNTQSTLGRVVEILGHEDDFGVDVEIVIRKHHIPHRFSSMVLEAAQSAAEAPISGRDLQGRRDFRDVTIVTIDGETARDFDDAVAVRRLPHGAGWELQVHIADVAHYVREGSAIDTEARTRGTSVYFPDRAVPMLPLELSTDVCSLRPHVDRLVLSCVMEIDTHGDTTSYELCEGVIRSAERLTYTDVNAVIEGDTHLCERYEPLVESFRLMRDLARVLNRKRERRGSIDFDLPEAQIEFDELGMMRAITRSERNDAHRLIEEFMLAANESVASYLEQKGIASLYRIHELPDPKRVLEVETLAATFGYSLGVGALPVQRFTPRGDRRAGYGGARKPAPIELPQEVRITPQMYQKLTHKTAGTPEERILSYLMLRSLRQARYSEENAGHFALAAPSYTHFTSPIRRYPDLIVHRILKATLRESPEAREPQDGGEVPLGRGVPDARSYAEVSAGEDASARNKESSRKQTHGRDNTLDRKHKNEANEDLSGPVDQEELHEIAEQSSLTERRAADAERELLEWKKIKFMQDRVGEEFTGLVVSVTKYGFFVELTDLFVEGFVPVASLNRDRYTFRENTRQIMGERSHHAYSLGDRVQVWVDRIDRLQRRIQFAVAEAEPQIGTRRSGFHAAGTHHKKKRKRH